MRRVLWGVGLALVVVGGLGVPAASAQGGSISGEDGNTGFVRDLNPAPNGYWTEERIRSAESNNLDLIEETQSDNTLTTRAFSAEEYEVVVYRDIPAPLVPIEVDDISYPSYVGKVLISWVEDDETIYSGACTGTVIASSSKSLVQSAGHCIWPYITDEDSGDLDWAFMDRLDQATVYADFIPAYHVLSNGERQSPYGEWVLGSAAGHNCWIEDRDASCDEVFLRAEMGPMGEPGLLQHVVGGIGLSIGGSAHRGSTIDEPWLPRLGMFSYPYVETADRKPDPNRGYWCYGTSEESAYHDGAIQFPCDEPITGGASGAAIVEYGQSGQVSIATYFGRNPAAPNMLQAHFNDSGTKDLYHLADNTPS